MQPSDVLKLILIIWLEFIGDKDSAKKVSEKGLPTIIYIHGQEDSEFKIPLTQCVIRKRRVIEAGKMLIDYSPIRPTSGFVSSIDSVGFCAGEAIVPIKGCEFILRGQQNRPEMKECKDKAFTYNAKAIPDTEWSDMLERWNTKVSHEEDMGK